MKKLFFPLLFLGCSGFSAPYVKQPAPAYFEQGAALKEGQFPAAYNAPARPAFVRGWNFFLTGSFLYWLAEQEGMEIAVPTSASLSLTPGSETISLSSTNGASYIRSDFEFSQGYKAGLGFSCDQEDYWIGALEYTWMHQNVRTPTISEDVVTISRASASAKFLGLTSWFVGNRGIFPLMPALQVGAKWKMHMDLGDAYLGRPYYQGRYVTMTPFAGVRGVWLRQNFRVQSTLPTIPGLFSSVNPVVSHNYSHSWAVGPRLGLQGRWLLGWGFRVEGDAAGALLFTRYTKVSHRESEVSFTPTAGVTFINSHHFSFKDYNTVRPMTNAGIGFGWGGYLGWCRDPSVFLDISANYDFLQFWGQNMMEKLVNDYISGIDTPASDLHLQGVTATVRIDF